MALTAEQLGPFGVRFREALTPWMTSSLEVVCAAVGAMGFNHLLELIEEEGTQGEPGWVPPWGKLLNPSLAPNESVLAYLGQYVGVPVPTGSTEAEARALVKAESGLQRGTTAAVKAAIERSVSVFWAPDTAFTTGQLVRHESIPGVLKCYEATANFTSGITFNTTHLTEGNIATQYELLSRERANGETNAGYFTIVCHPQQLSPEGNLAQMEANVNSVKFWGLVPEYVLTEESLQTDPYIDEGSLLIEAAGGEIESATLADIT